MSLAGDAPPAPPVLAQLQTPSVSLQAHQQQPLHNFFAGAQTATKCPGAPIGGRAGGVVFGVPVVPAAAYSAARDAELEKELDLSKLELLPPTPMRSAGDSSTSDDSESDMELERSDE